MDALNPRPRRRPLAAAALALALPLATGALALAPASGEAAIAAAPAPAELAPLPQPVRRTVKTKAGVEVPVWMWPGSEWTGSPDWAPEGRSSPKPATGDIVLIVFDAGDGVSAEPLVQMLRAMGATVIAFDDPGVAFDHPIAGFDHPIAGFDHPIAGRENPEGDMGVAADTPENVLHAMISWAGSQAVKDGKAHRLHLFGVGRGADLALKVGAMRTGELRSILVDNPSYEVTAGATKLPIGDTENNLEAFAGVTVVRAGTSKLRRLGRGSVSLAPDSMTYPKAATISELAADGRYQQSVAAVVAGASRG